MRRQTLRTGVGTQSLCLGFRSSGQTYLVFPFSCPTDASVEDSVHPTQDGTDQEATSVLWRVLSSEAPSSSLGDFPHTRQTEQPALEEATPQIPGLIASGTPGEAQWGADSKGFSSPQPCFC